MDYNRGNVEYAKWRSQIKAMYAKLPGWLHVASIFELKALLWHGVLTSLVVLFLNDAVIQIRPDRLPWNFLVFRGSLVLISFAIVYNTWPLLQYRRRPSLFPEG